MTTRPILFSAPMIKALLREQDPNEWEMPKAAATGNVSPLFMPRWASRITLELTGVRVERVQDISEEDAADEGARVNEIAALTGRDWSSMPDQRAAFAALWEHINGAESWKANPWCWVLSFRRVAQAQEAATNG